MTIRGFSSINGNNGFLNLYGDESDGSITVNSNTSDSGVYYTTDYTLEAGNTLSLNGALVIFSTGKVTINGTINGTGAGGAGGQGGNVGQANEEPGEGHNVPVNASGGDGGDDSHTDGSGEPGGSTNYTSSEQSKYGSQFLVGPTPTPWVDIVSGSITIGHGGGGAQGGSQSSTVEVTSGGDGGDGGAGVIIVASEIEITGSIVAQGTDGQDGGDAPDSTNPDDNLGGGGGGGSGGSVFFFCESIVDNGSYDLSGGLGGDGGTNSDGSSVAEDGKDGGDGTVHIITS